MRIFKSSSFCLSLRNIFLIIFLLFSFLNQDTKAQSFADLTLVKTADKTIAGIDENVTFTIVIKNNGPSIARNVRVTDVLASGFTFVSVATSTGSWSTPIWSVGNMALNQTETMTLVAKVNPFGNYTNTASIKADEPDLNLGNNYSKTTLGVIRTIDDYGYINGTTGGDAIANVTANDFLNGAFVKLSNVNIEELSRTSANVYLDPVTAKIIVLPNTPIGNYQVVYKMTDKNNPLLFSSSIVNINVNSNNSGGSSVKIAANPDTGYITGSTGGIAIFNVLGNDVVADAKADLSTVTLEAVSTTNNNITLDITSGGVNVLPNTPNGVYTLVYKITDKLNPSITALGNVIISVVTAAGSIAANNDFGTIDGGTGGVAVLNVLENDLVDGGFASVSNVTISRLFTGHSGVDINTATGEVTVAAGTPNGYYTLTYQIINNSNPSAFAVADVLVTVTGGLSLIKANIDNGVANGTTGGIAVENVLANDDLSGAVPVLSQVNLTQIFSNSGGVNLDFTTGRVLVNPGTPNGYYTVAYLIEDKANSAVSSYNDVYVQVTGGISLITAIEDSGAINGDTGGIAVTNVLANDDFKGVVPLIADVNLTQTFSNNPNISLNENTGAVIVQPGTENGVYTVAYYIEDKNDPESFSYADVIISVTAGVPPILANDDNGTANGTIGGVAVNNVLTNDLLGIVEPSLSKVTLTQISSTHAGVILETTTGKVLVSAGTPVGDYILVYQIEDKENSGNISQANVTVKVTKTSQIIANNDTGKINRLTGGVAITNVLANDNLEGIVPLLSHVTITQRFSNHPDVNVDVRTGAVVVAPGTATGFYTVTYQIEDKLNPGSIAYADAIVEVSDDSSPIIAINDKGLINGLIGGVAIPNILANDVINGLPATLANVDIAFEFTQDPRITLDIHTGSVTVAAGTLAGDYILVYTIKDKLNPTVTSTAFIEIAVTNDDLLARNDSGTIDGIIGGIAVNNVLSNDILGTNAPLISEVILTMLSSTHSGVTLDPATGNVIVAAGTPIGVYTLVYQIEDKANPGRLAQATVTINVNNVSQIVANEDRGTVNRLTGGIAVANVLANDNLKGIEPLLSQVNIIQTFTNNSGVNLNPLTGSVEVISGTPVGFYTVSYQIEDKANPGSTALADVIIEVTDDVSTVLAIRDISGGINGVTGGLAIPNVLVNDTFSGLPATFADVNLVFESTTNPQVTLDVNTGEVRVAAGTPGGLYILVYTLKDKQNPTNTSTTYVEVTVLNNIIANNDAGTINGITGGIAVTNVLDNDTFNGNPIDPANVTLSQVSSGHPNIILDPLTGKVEVAPNTPAGIFNLVYQVVDKSNPAIVAEATVVVTVSNPLIGALDDAGTVSGVLGGEAVSNILINDTFNGAGANLNNVTIIQLSTTNSKVKVDVLTGKALVEPGTLPGVYTIVYSITDKLNPANVAIARVVVTVVNQSNITPLNDEATIDGLTDIIAIPNILVNDKVNGEQATFANVTITNISGITNNEISVDAAKGAVNVAAGIAPGIYIFTYEIFETSNPANRRAAEIKITVTGLTRIGIAKMVSVPKPEADGTYNLTYTINAKNFGNTTLTDISIVDDLKLTFPAPLTFSVISAPTGTGSLVPNPAFNGDNDTELLRNTSTLIPGANETVSFTVNVKLNKSSGTYLNTAIANALGFGGATTTDESTDGVNPDANGDNNPDEKTPTPIDLKSITIYIPEGFSPNNDGVNDKFIIKSTAGDQVSLEVYNRWGNIVYKNSDYQNEWTGKANQGIKIGEDLPDGTYYYIVVLNGKERFVRYITLKR